MAKKRKHDSKPSEPSEPPVKQQQKLQQHELLDDEDEYEEVEEEQEIEEEVEVENDDESDDNNNNNNNNNNQISYSSAGDQGDDDDDNDDEEPLETLMEPFAKEQLINLLREAADKHQDVADRIRLVADEDPVHRKIFVHGLGWDTNAETLMNAFQPYGEIEDCKAVTDKVSGKSKGYGFILFKSRSGARKALKEPQKRIGNRMTACQLAAVGPAAAPAAATSSVAAPLQPVSEYTQRKIYVSNVGADLDPQKLVNFFAKFGEIEEGPLGLDKVTGKPKGFCLFVYKSVESARKALEEPHKNFEGHILHCQKAIDGPKPGKSQQQPRHHNVARNDNAAGYGPGNAAGASHMMGPSAGPRMGFNQGAAAAPALNPALGQALTALLATQGAGLGGLTNLLGTLGSTAVNPGGVGAPGMQGYGNQANVSPGLIGAYASQGAMQGGYPNQQMGQGGSGRGQHGGGQYGGVAPYMGH